jgi:fatty-acid peroxygenase
MLRPASRLRNAADSVRAPGRLANRISYDVPRQDLRIDMRRLPALPADGFVIANVQAL